MDPIDFQTQKFNGLMEELYQALYDSLDMVGSLDKVKAQILRFFIPHYIIIDCISKNEIHIIFADEIDLIQLYQDETGENFLTLSLPTVDAVEMRHIDLVESLLACLKSTSST